MAGCGLSPGSCPFKIGLVSGAALLGTALTTLAVGLLAARFDLRQLLLLDGYLMIAAGTAFTNVDDARCSTSRLHRVP
jgi:hypothetical protein